MSTHRGSLKNREVRKQIVRTLRRRLSLLIGFLIALLLVTIFKIGEAWWPTWLITHRTQMGGILVLAIILFLLLAPIIIEADSNPRPLDGPGKNPYNG